MNSPLENIEAVKVALGGILCNRNPGDHCFGLPFPDEAAGSMELQPDIMYFVPFFSFGEYFDRFLMVWEAGTVIVSPAIYSNSSYFYPHELMKQYTDYTEDAEMELRIPRIWLSLGWYWLAINSNTSFDVLILSYIPLNMIHRNAAGVGGNYLTVAHTHGTALPSTAAAGMTIVTTGAPRFGLRKAA